MEICHRLAELKDLPLLCQLMEAFYTLDGHDFQAETAQRVLKGIIENDTYGRLWVITADGLAIGYVAVTLGYSLEYGGRDAFVDEIFLQQAYRGQGIGAQTFAFVEAECRALAVRALHLEVMPENTRAYALYGKLGYRDRHSALLTKRL